MAGNRLRIDYLLGGSVVKPFSVHDAVHSGILDGGHTVAAYWYGKHKAASLFGSGPPGVGTPTTCWAGSTTVAATSCTRN